MQLIALSEAIKYTLQEELTKQNRKNVLLGGESPAVKFIQPVFLLAGTPGGTFLTFFGEMRLGALFSCAYSLFSLYPFTGAMEFIDG